MDVRFRVGVSAHEALCSRMMSPTTMDPTKTSTRVSTEARMEAVKKEPEGTQRPHLWQAFEIHHRHRV